MDLRLFLERRIFFVALGLLGILLTSKGFNFFGFLLRILLFLQLVPEVNLVNLHAHPLRLVRNQITYELGENDEQNYQQQEDS